MGGGVSNFGAECREVRVRRAMMRSANEVDAAVVVDDGMVPAGVWVDDQSVGLVADGPVRHAWEDCQSAGCVSNAYGGRGDSTDD